LAKIKLNHEAGSQQPPLDTSGYAPDASMQKYNAIMMPPPAIPLTVQANPEIPPPAIPLSVQASPEVTSGVEEEVVRRRRKRSIFGSRKEKSSDRTRTISRRASMSIDTMKNKIVDDLASSFGSDDILGSSSIPRYVLHPNCEFLKWWDGTLFVAILYLSIFLPLRFGFDLETSKTTNDFEVFIDLVLLADMCIQFRTGFYHVANEYFFTTLALITLNFLLTPSLH
jgi:hypothetical protein